MGSSFLFLAFSTLPEVLAFSSSPRSLFESRRLTFSFYFSPSPFPPIPSFRHFGSEIISTHLSLPSSSPIIPLLHLKLYDDFIEAIDGIDNGIPQYTSTPAYKSKTDLSSRISYLNPNWNESSNDQDGMIRFEKASKLAGEEFFDRLDYSFKAWLPAREIVLKALEERKNVEGGDKGGRVLVFEGYASWKVSFPKFYCFSGTFDETFHWSLFE